MPAAPSHPETIDHFRIVARLGMGGMGVVYSAEDLLLHRPVALKVMRAEHVADPLRRARFLREARTAASLVHPNVATVYEVGEVDGTIFIAMELVPGETLRTVLSFALRERTEVKRALRWSVGIARALARAHELGIVHRDLKPDNVMVLPDDEVKLLDFGIAKGLMSESEGAAIPAADSMTVEGVVLGTPAYMSPEQARGERLDVRSDVFSFGTMLFEMLSGSCPFLRATPLDTLAAIVRDAVPRLDDAGANVPSDVQAILARCLAKAPAERFANGGELLAALQRAALDETVDLPAIVSRPSGIPRAAPAPTTGTESTFGPAGSRSEEGNGRAARIGPWLAAIGVVGVVGAIAIVASRPRGRAREGADAVAASAVPVAGCTSNAACSREHDGGAWKCNSARHVCVEIAPEGEGCTAFTSPGDLEAEDTVWIGSCCRRRGRPEMRLPRSVERLSLGGATLPMLLAVARHATEGSMRGG